MVRVITMLNPDTQRTVSRITTRRAAVGLIPLCVLCLLLGGVMLWLEWDTGEYMTASILFALGLLLDPLFLLIMRVASRQAAQRPLVRQGVVNVFFFDANGFMLRQRSGMDYTDEMRCPYWALAGAEEASDYFIIRMDSAAVHFVPVCDIKEGTADELAYYLACALGVKFRTKRQLPIAPPVIAQPQTEQAMPQQATAPAQDAEERTDAVQEDKPEQNG